MCGLLQSRHDATGHESSGILYSHGYSNCNSPFGSYRRRGRRTLDHQGLLRVSEPRSGDTFSDLTSCMLVSPLCLLREPCTQFRSYRGCTQPRRGHVASKRPGPTVTANIMAAPAIILHQSPSKPSGASVPDPCSSWELLPMVPCRIVGGPCGGACGVDGVLAACIPLLEEFVTVVIQRDSLLVVFCAPLPMFLGPPLGASSLSWMGNSTKGSGQTPLKLNTTVLRYSMHWGATAHLSMHTIYAYVIATAPAIILRKSPSTPSGA